MIEATEVSDGLIVYIDQGKKVIDCTSYTTTEEELFTVDIYEPKFEIDPVMNVTYVKQDFDFDNYEKTRTEYFATGREMKVYVSELVMNSAYF